MAKFTEIQGNSLWLNVLCETFADIDAVWANFTGKWSIQDSAGVVKCFGDMTRSTTDEGIMYVRITAAQIRALLVSEYTITFQIYHVLSGFEEESHHTLVIDKAERIV